MIFTMNTQLTLVVALVASTSGYLIKISENLSTENCQDVLNNLEALLSSPAMDRVNNDVETTVILPQNWVKAGCQPARRSVSLADTMEAEDIVVSDMEVMWTVQHGGCGHKGLRVNVPKQFLIFNTTSEMEAKSESLVAEMIKYQFGVFEETGYMEDKMYPATYTTGNSSYETVGCDMELTSGLFCDNQESYNRLAPSKQNVLCGGRSVMEVIGLEAHGHNQTRNTSVRYVTSSQSRYVLVLDLAHEADTWTNIKRSLWRFIAMIPEGSSLSIVSVQEDTSSVLLFPTVVTDGRREGLHGLIPRRSEETRVSRGGCVDCGLDTAMELLGQHTGNIIIVSNGHVQTRDSTHGQFRIFSLMYGQQSAVESNATVYNVQDTSSSSLTEVFINILNIVESNQEKLEVIYHKKHEGSQISGDFYVEETASTDITVTLSIDDEQKVESFEVLDSTGKRNIFSKFEDGLVIIKMLGKSNSGMWSYHIKLYEDPLVGDNNNVAVDSKLIIDVTSKSEGGSVTVITMPSIGENSNHHHHHQILMTEVSQAGRPVVGASVTAVITGPDGSRVHLDLRDTGMGYPDITRGDGVYSAYIPVFATSVGYHDVRIHVSSDEDTRVNILDASGDISARCCGSEVFSASQETVGQFVRYSTQPSVFISETNLMQEDLTPPSKITDLRVTSANSTSLLVDLQWSAPGGDLDSGSVTSYEIRCHTDYNLLSQDNFGDKGILVHPVEAINVGSYLSAQQASAGLPWTNQMFYYALVSRDQAGNVSPVSNIVSVIINEVITTTETSSLAPSQLKLGGQSWLLNTNYIIAIAGGCGGVLLIIIFVVVFMIFRAKRSNKEKSSKDVLDTYEAGFYPDIKLSKPDTETSNDGVYNWLDGLQQTSKKTSGPVTSPSGPKVTINEAMDLCYEEGSSCSRPTTSTDDSLSNEEAEYVNQTRNSHENNNHLQTSADPAAVQEMQQAALQQLSRQRMYSNSFKYHHRYQAQYNNHRYAPPPGPQYPPMVAPKKQRHESVV